MQKFHRNIFLVIFWPQPPWPPVLCVSQVAISGPARELAILTMPIDVEHYTLLSNLVLCKCHLERHISNKVISTVVNIKIINLISYTHLESIWLTFSMWWKTILNTTRNVFKGQGCSSLWLPEAKKKECKQDF